MSTHRRRSQEQVAELQQRLAALGPAPADAVGRWQHQTEVHRLEREIERLTRRRRRATESAPA